jgi:hypothetical protein
MSSPSSPSSPNFDQLLYELAKCFLEGPQAPPDRVLPPDTFRLRVWQVIPKGSKTGKLYLTIEGLSSPPVLEEVEVVFEGVEGIAQPMKRWTSTTKELDFDLPTLWAEDPGSRFVTVYIREKGATAEAARDAKNLKKVQERPTTIIRIVPAPLNSSAALDYDDHRPADDGDD